MKLNNFQLALVTGASSGLGKGLCEALAKLQIPLIMVARDREKLQNLATSLPVSTTLLAVDLSIASERAKLITLIEERCPDLIFNNAGFGLYGDILSHPLAEQMGMIDLNIKALVEISIKAASSLCSHQKKGVIVNISSAAAFLPYPSFTIYAATKAFVNQFSQGFDEEVAEKGIRVLTVCPGQIHTSFRKRASLDFPQEEDAWTMPVEKVVKLIFSQIEKGARLKIIDGRYAFFIRLARMLPTAFLMKLLKKSLQKRIRKSY